MSLLPESGSGQVGTTPDPLGRYRRPLGVSVAVAMALYVTALILSDGQTLASRVLALPPAVVALSLTLPTLGFLVRFLRWDLYVRALGHRLSPGRHLRIYLAGFALTTTPGKVGENLRAVYLEPEGVPYSHALAAFLVERLGDVVAMILLAGLAGRLLGRFAWTVYLFAVLTILVVAALRHPAIHSAMARGIGSRHWGERALAGIARTLSNARALLSVRLIAPGIAIALVAWGAEACTFALLSQALGMTVPFQVCMGIFAVATLVGAVSFLPGGLGPTEATMVGLLILAGGGLAEATAVTLLVRAVTLWWAVLLGVVALVGLNDPSKPGAGATGDAAT